MMQFVLKSTDHTPLGVVRALRAMLAENGTRLNEEVARLEAEWAESQRELVAVQSQLASIDAWLVEHGGAQ